MAWFGRVSPAREMTRLPLPPSVSSLVRDSTVLEMKDRVSLPRLGFVLQAGEARNSTRPTEPLTWLSRLRRFGLVDDARLVRLALLELSLEL